jgi:hypothetical protein
MAGGRVDRADLAVRRPSGAILWPWNLSLIELPLAWARAENAHGADLYLRPARGPAWWPMVFQDDVNVGLGLTTANAHGVVAMQTPAAGGCHLWLPCARTLDEAERHRAQRWFAEKFGDDRGSISGEHLGRLAGFQNGKRGGCWVNDLAYPSLLCHHSASARRASKSIKLRGQEIRRRPMPQWFRRITYGPQCPGTGPTLDHVLGRTLPGPPR